MRHFYSKFTPQRSLPPPADSPPPCTQSPKSLPSTSPLHQYTETPHPDPASPEKRTEVATPPQAYTSTDSPPVQASPPTHDTSPLAFACISALECASNQPSTHRLDIAPNLPINCGIQSRQHSKRRTPYIADFLLVEAATPRIIVPLLHSIIRSIWIARDQFLHQGDSGHIAHSRIFTQQLIPSLPCAHPSLTK